MRQTQRQRLAIIDRMSRIKDQAERPFDSVTVDAFGLVGLSAAVDELCNRWEEFVLDIIDEKLDI